MAKIVEDNIVQGIINYLSSRPYADVANVMPILMNLPDYKENLAADVKEEVNDSNKDDKPAC